jgi:hypothetical protein
MVDDLSFPPTDGLPVPVPGVPQFAIPPPGKKIMEMRKTKKYESTLN